MTFRAPTGANSGARRLAAGRDSPGTVCDRAALEGREAVRAINRIRIPRAPGFAIRSTLWQGSCCRFVSDGVGRLRATT
jgi:hypothetical protein